MKRRTLVGSLAATAVAAPFVHANAQAPMTLNGAVQFNDDHAFNKALLRFEELVKKYYGKPVNFVLHRNSSLGLEKQWSRHWSSMLEYTRYERTSAFATGEFKQNLIYLSIAYRNR